MKLQMVINTLNTMRTNGIQAAINNLSDGYVDPTYFPFVEDSFGNRFCRPYVNDLVGIYDHYAIMPEKDDIVFDIGAFIGGFTIPAAKRASVVYSFEPLYFSELKNNVAANNLTNVKLYEIALGERGMHEAEYFKKKVVLTAPFGVMRSMTAASPTFLKCNCEGAEWGLTKEDFAGINTVEIQFHYSDNIDDNPLLLGWLKDNYVCTEMIKPADGINGIHTTLNLHGRIRKD
jgi:hypothetical protein